jgi:hypothetical protein
MGAIDETLYWAPGWLLVLPLLVLLLVATEAGYRAGAASRSRRGAGGGDGGPPDLGTIQGAVLGLLALLLAFTYSFVTGRADARKQAVVSEANAIGTAWLRAGLVADPHRSELRRLLRQYLDTRIVSDEVGGDRERLAALMGESERVQSQLWPSVERAVGSHSPPNPIDGLLAGAMNDVIDMHTTRMAAGLDRLPGIILLMLFAIATASMGVTGYSGGLTGARNLAMTTMLAFMVTAVAYVIVDLDQPRRGLVRVSQRSLIELRESINRDAAQSSRAIGPKGTAASN